MSTPNTGTASLPAKRMAKERQGLEQENDDYVAFFTDEDMLSFTAYVKGPEDSLYRYKLVKLQFAIPSTYPFVPPKVTFVQHTGDRIHPNLYVNGKVCLSILGTWPGEPWAFGMTNHSVLITIRSLLDNKPYCHEPNQRDNPDFNEYVQYATWRWLLLDYLKHEKNPAARAWLRRHVRRNGSEMLIELQRQQDEYLAGRGVSVVAGASAGASAGPSASVRIQGLPLQVGSQPRHFVNPYARLQPLVPNYGTLIRELEEAWMSTLVDGVSDGAGGSGSGSGSSKRKIDAAETTEVSNLEVNSSNGQKEPDKLDQPRASHKLTVPPSPPPPPSPPHTSNEQSQRPKKRAKEDPEIIDLT